MSDVQDLYRRRLTTPAEALRDLPKRCSVLFGIFAAQPPALVQAFADRAQAGEIGEALLYYMHATPQFLWTHGSCWKTEPPFAADLTTYLDQYNESPWCERLRVANLETKQAERVPADTRPPPDRAAEISCCPTSTSSLPAA